MTTSLSEIDVRAVTLLGSVRKNEKRKAAKERRERRRRREKELDCAGAAPQT